jgi:hypothetical protein
MVAGLPGTGIGGLFYLLLVALMPLRHGWRALRHRARAGQGRLVLRSLAFAGAILVVLWVQAWVLQAALLALAPLFADGLPAVLAQVAGTSTSAYVKAAAFATFGSLALVIGAVHVLRLVVRPPAPPAPAEAPVLELPQAARRAG